MIFPLSLYVLHTVHCLREVYGHALHNLQQCLKNGQGARSSETLCGTVLLSIYEVCRSIAAEDKIDGL